MYQSAGPSLMLRDKPWPSEARQQATILNLMAHRAASALLWALFRGRGGWVSWARAAANTALSMEGGGGAVCTSHT